MRPSRGRPARRGALAPLGHAARGLVFALRREPHLRVHVVAAAAVLAAAGLVGVSAAELTALILAIGLVLSAELLNTAVEAALDAAVPRQHPLVGLAKDAAAAAVLVASLAVLAVGVVVFGDEIAGIGP